MFFVSTYRVFLFAFQNFFRNFWLALVTITIIILTLFSFATLTALNAAANAATAALESRVNITLYFDPSVSSDEVASYQGALEEWPGVAHVDRVAPDDALERFKNDHAQDPLILSSLAELEQNPLGPSLIVSAVSIDDMPAVITKVEQAPFAQKLTKKDFENHTAIISKLNAVSAKVNQIGIIISSIFIAIAALVVFNTIRIGIYTRRDEIAIMRLVGASNIFIRMPFVIEGALYALISCIIFWGIFFILLQAAESYTGILFIDIGFNMTHYFREHFSEFFLWNLLAVIGLNFAAVSIALGRYLRV